jgi:hypothetical protein
MKRSLSWLWLGATVSALAQTPSPPADEESRIAAARDQLQAERTVVEQAHDARMRECWQRFAVNACLSEVRRSRYAALDPIRAKELELDVQERAWRTQQREERLREKSDQHDKGESTGQETRRP